ncbi:Kinesin-like protein Klp61F [Eumeta japonica]|uniref:Kinesin-like protein Klp61F n=1 Tax=Eumeta variegata TaxID=151549 RepID=A0A4C1TD83_EUMVA|nr:Kinesin-like protein Klp61F [Eumeta japonica]
MSTEKANKKEKNQNIQVFVRLRPLNQRERDIRSLGVVEVLNGKEIVVRQSAHVSHAKKFTFDRAFGPTAKQVEVYQDVVSPLIEEVLAGYNCTVFAYGQTGTGKTHTMVGENTGDETSWQNKITPKLRIYEDITRKGSNIVNGLEEITVYNKNEVYKIMAQGQERKRVEGRSHTVFTIVVHMKENSPEGEELVKIGKLNLVDLAGSENISKAGSDNPAKRERARECVNINQSLLTLGRVITALVERHPHIPYRESKLTRILQESLGGRTKTSIIATVSPGHKDLEETLSTLEYAYRAKNIQNKPEVNQKMTKKAILKEYAEEIDRLKRDLQAARDKNGVYLANETFTEMTLKQEEQKKEIQELLLRKRAMEEERERMEIIFNELNCVLKEKEAQLDQTKQKLGLTRNALTNTKNMLETTNQYYEEQKHLVVKHVETEAKLNQQAEELMGVLDLATGHLSTLHNAFDRSRNLEKSNLELTKSFHVKSLEHQDTMKQEIDNFSVNLIKTLQTMLCSLNEQLAKSEKLQLGSKHTVEELILKIEETTSMVKTVMTQTRGIMLSANNDNERDIKKLAGEHEGIINSSLQHFLAIQLQSVTDVSTLQEQTRKEVHGAVETWQEKSSVVLGGLAQEFETFTSSLEKYTNAMKERAHNGHERRTEQRLQRSRRSKQLYQQVLNQHQLFGQLLTEEKTKIEEDKKQFDEFYGQWLTQFQQFKKTNDEKTTQQMNKIERLQIIHEQNMNILSQWQKSEELFDKEEQNFDNESLKEQDVTSRETLKYVVDFSEHFKEGTSSLAVDVASCSGRVSEALHIGYTESLEKLEMNATETKAAAQKLESSLKDSCLHLNERVKQAICQVVDVYTQCSDTVVQNVEALDKLCSEDLNKVVQTTCELIDNSAKSHVTLTAEIHRIKSQTDCFCKNSNGTIAQQELLEKQYLQEEYRKYSPTGTTPLRREYHAPRTLAVTSPHERILARYRAARYAHDDDCVVVSSDDSPRPSDVDSVGSVDSMFVAPSPPAPLITSDLSLPGAQLDSRNVTPAKIMLKSISETDLYYKKRNNHWNSIPNTIDEMEPSSEGKTLSILPRHDKIILLHDNAHPHVAVLVKNYLKTLDWEVLRHPPYSPDIAPSDYHLFRSMAHALSEQLFTSYEDSKNWVDSWIASKGKENLECNVSVRSKASKLPAPISVSAKKPLVDRNVAL